ncbi:hypothetical protein Tco_1361164, partial [Tanacetum coccineum]
HVEDDMGLYTDEIREHAEKIADDLRDIAYYIIKNVTLRIPSHLPEYQLFYGAWPFEQYQQDLGFGGGGCLKEYVRVVAGMDDGEKDTKVVKYKVSQEHVCEEEVPLNNNIGKQSGDLVEIPSEAVEKGMEDHVLDEIDAAKGEQVPNHVGKKGNLEFLVCKQVANHGGDELVDKGRPLNREKVYAQ